MKKDETRVVESTKNQFTPILGEFYAFWSTAEIVTSMGIGVLLNLNEKDTHLLTARMEFSRKAALIRRMASEKKHSNASQIRGALNKIQNESKRNSFAHSLVIWGENEMFFVERTWEHDYVARLHSFTLKEFETHVKSFAGATGDLRRAFGFTRARIVKFATTAFKAQRKASKSPTPPKRKA